MTLTRPVPAAAFSGQAHTLGGSSVSALPVRYPKPQVTPIPYRRRKKRTGDAVPVLCPDIQDQTQDGEVLLSRFDHAIANAFLRHHQLRPVMQEVLNRVCDEDAASEPPCPTCGRYTVLEDEDEGCDRS